ncbi:hypothetical protein B0T10DRAFT_600804 [Thelonectria olida]|uniref:Uncharacterized protein n=1 Tax=Thelonectria olida TaxID=1576542 RepID=A0A9P9AXT3_9HYPO|nr:hypothetical protein B0T10DRAFT_600804 [Thelonectria olida]
MSQSSNETVFQYPEDQSGPIVVMMRVMQLWELLIEKLVSRLWHNSHKWGFWYMEDDPWPQEAQVRIAHCYMDYSHQTAMLLTRLKEQEAKFDDTDPLRKLVNSKIEHWDKLYKTIALALYRYVDKSVWGNWTPGPTPDDRLPEERFHEVLNGTFPSIIPEWFKTFHPQPLPGSLIGPWVRENDAPLTPRFRVFNKTLMAWNFTAPKIIYVDPPTCKPSC